MMANKLLLVPESIYRGLTSTDTGEPNLDFAKRELENVKKQKIDSSRKNILYNQQLRRYLNLRNEREERPTKVELTKGLRMLIKKGDDDDEILLEEQPPNFPKKPEGAKKKKPQPEPDDMSSSSSYASLPRTDDFFMPERDEEIRGKKRKNVDEPAFPPKRWPLPVPEPAFRESTKRKYFKAKSNPVLTPTTRMGNPTATINEENDEFGNSPPSSPLDWFEKRREPELIQISTVGVRRDRKRKGEESNDERIGIKKSRYVPPLAKPKPKPKYKISNIKKNPVLSKEIVLANKQPTPVDDITEALRAPLPKKQKPIPGEILIPSAEVRAERKRTLEGEEGIPAKKIKQSFPQPTRIKKINWAQRKPTNADTKINWAQRKPTSADTKINWAQRKPTSADMKINWAKRKPTKEEGVKKGYK